MRINLDIPKGFDKIQEYAADYLRTYRLYKEWTLEVASDMSDVTPSRIHNLELGESIVLMTMYSLCQTHGLLLSTVFEFAELAAQIGLEAAYLSEAPHLLEYRQPIHQYVSTRGSK